jgi:hypothetical protein
MKLLLWIFQLAVGCHHGQLSRVDQAPNLPGLLGVRTGIPLFVGADALSTVECC